MAPASSSLWRLAMRRSTLAICALLTVATFGCDQVNAAKDKLKLAWDKIRGRQTAAHTPPPPIRPAPDTAGARQAAQPQRQQAAPPPPAPSPPQGTGGNPDLPYISAGTHPIAPAMGQRGTHVLSGWPA